MYSFRKSIAFPLVFAAPFVFACECVGFDDDNGDNGNGDEGTVGLMIVEGNSGKEGDYLSMEIALDGEHVVHGVYYYNEVGGVSELRYASGTLEEDWTIERISPAEDSVLQERADIGVDSLGGVHVIFGTSTPRAIWHATKTGIGPLAYAKIADLPNSPNHISLFIDKHDRLHVAYSVNNHDYRYAYKDRNADWEDEPIYRATNAGYSVAVAVDSDDFIHLVHHSQRSMFHLFRHTNDEEWSEPIELVDGLSSLGATVSLGLTKDGEDVLHVFFNDGQGANNTRSLRKSPGEDFREVALGLSRTAYTNRGICSPDTGGAFITFQPFSDWSMSAVFISSAEQISQPFVIDSHGDIRMGAHSSCTVDTSGNLHLLYNQSTLENKALKYALVPKALLP